MPSNVHSLFGTPGRRAYGDAGLITEGDLEGMQIAYLVRDSFGAEARAPIFGKGTTIVGQKKVSGLFLATAFFHPPGEPEKYGVLGKWCVDSEDCKTISKVKSLLKTHKVKVPEHEGQYINNFWDDWMYGGNFEPSVVVTFRASCGTLRMPIQSNVVHHILSAPDDPEVYILNGVLRACNWKPTFSELDGYVDIDRVMAMLTVTYELPYAIYPAPPSGLVPVEPSFKAIPVDAFCLQGRTFNMGLAAGVPGNAIQYLTPDGKFEYGTVVARPQQDGGGAQMRVLQPVKQCAEIDEQWYCHSRALVLRLDTMELPKSNLWRVTLVPPQALFAFRLERSDAYVLTHVEISPGEFISVSEPTTRQQVLQSVAAWAAAHGNEDEEILLEGVRNEVTPPLPPQAPPAPCPTQHNPSWHPTPSHPTPPQVRLQSVPEKQDSLSNACIELRNFSLSQAVVITNDLKWRGDRSLTFDSYLTEVELRRLIPQLGWEVPAPEPDRAGRIRTRRRNKGFLLIMTHKDQDESGTNRIEYCMETKRFRVFLALAHFGENLEFVRGAVLPEGVGKYDLVTRAHLGRRAAHADSVILSVPAP